MVTGCGCHDPIVFGHQDRCQLGLGPPPPYRGCPPTAQLPAENYYEQRWREMERARAEKQAAAAAKATWRQFFKAGG